MCPYLDESDTRCAAHLTLSNVQSAYEHCVNRFWNCPVYCQISCEKGPAVAAETSAEYLAAS